MKKILLTLTAIASLTMANYSAKAALGWTLAECTQHYGKGIKETRTVSGGRTAYDFKSKGYYIHICILDGKVSRVSYFKSAGFDLARIQNLLESNAPEATWGDPEKDEASNDYRFDGTANGQIAYTAAATNDSLTIWTEADNEAVRIAHVQDDKDL